MSTTTCKDSSAFQQHRDDVYRWAYRLLGRHHDALDVAQDVFVRWSQATGADSRDVKPSMLASSQAAFENPRAWLRRVTINRAIDVMRARTTAIALAEQPQLGPHITDDLERAELRQEITLALESLTDSQRSVLVSKVFDDLTFAQIAAEQGLAIPTVKTHYLRAVIALRDRLHRLHLLEGKGTDHEQFNQSRQ
jgi:RNA polymerase sigma factor (sigma-70 family)